MDPKNEKLTGVSRESLISGTKNFEKVDTRKVTS